MQQPARAGVETLYPARVQFNDPLGVRVTLDFLLQVPCAVARRSQALSEALPDGSEGVIPQP